MNKPPATGEHPAVTVVASSRFAARVASFLARCAGLGITVRGDGTVSSAAAARLLNCAEQSLRQSPCYGSRCVPYQRDGRRVRYLVAELAAFIDC